MKLEKKKIEKLKSKFSKATRNESKFCLKSLGRERDREREREREKSWV